MGTRSLRTLAAAAVGLALTLTFAAVPAAGAVEPKSFSSGVTRLAGASRYETAVKVSQQYAPGVPAVYVATGSNFPDALSAASAAAYVGGPLLLTDSTSLPAAVKTEIQRLKPAKIFVVGGTNAVSASVEKTLKAIAPVTRYGEADRYSTGLKIVNGAFKSAETAIIATGRSFPDALAATGVAGKEKAPVILVDGVQSTVTSATLTTLKNLGVKNIVITGGTAVVSSGIESQLKKSGYQVKRYGGADRYATAALINSAYFPEGSTDTMFVATGSNFPDALAGAALAGRMGAPLYITDARCTPASISYSILSLNPSKVAVLGGPTVVSDAAAQNKTCGSTTVDWKVEALAWAAAYLQAFPQSRSELLANLLGEGFTNDEATYAVDNVAVNWNTQAKLTAQEVLKATTYSPFARTVMVNKLKSYGFTDSQASYGADNCGLAWKSPSTGAQTAPTVAYPVYGSTDMVTFLAKSLVAQEQVIDITWIRESGLDTATVLLDAYYEAVTQNPYVFAGGFTTTTTPTRVTLEPDYIYTKTEAKRRQDATLAKVNAIVATPAVKNAATPAAKLIAIHDAVITAGTYDLAAWDAILDGADGSTPGVVARSQEAYGILVEGFGVCTSYAEAFMLAANAVGIQTVVVTGLADSSDSTTAHAWDMVNVNSQWLVVDATWDDGDEVVPVHTFLLIQKSDPLLAGRARDNDWVVDSNLSKYGY